MTTMMILALASALQTTTPSAPALQVSVPPVAGTAADPTCGGRAALAAIATCVATTQAAVETVVDAWNTDFMAQGWIAADGTENRVVYVRRRPEGGCDAFQLLAFAAEGAAPAPAAPAFLALAAVPGDVCAAAPGSGAPAQ